MLAVNMHSLSGLLIVVATACTCVFLDQRCMMHALALQCLPTFKLARFVQMSVIPT